MFDSKEEMKKDASKELSIIDAAMILAKNNVFGCEIHISGLVIGLADNTWIIPILKKERAEIEKYLNGEPNKWV
jgi:hypothetical protein